MSIRSLNRQYPWVPPLIVLTMAMGALVQSERRRPAPLDIHNVEPTHDGASEAQFLLLRTATDINEVYVCPSSNAEKWDFGGGANTALNWSNWQESSTSRSLSNGTK